MWSYFLAAFVRIASLSKKARPLAAAGIGILLAGPMLLLLNNLPFAGADVALVGHRPAE